MKTTIRGFAVCSLIFGVSVLGCGGNRKEHEEQAAKQPVLVPLPSKRDATESKLPNTKSNSTVPVDNSLTTEKYMDLGVPSPDRTWYSSDLAAASKVISDISNRDPTQLPRYESEKSGKIFERMVSLQNIQGLQNQTLPLDFRIPEAMKFMEAANAVNLAYLRGLLAHSTSDDEMTDVTGLMLHLSATMTELIQEFVPTLDKQSPTYPVRMEGLKTFKSGMANVMQGSIQQISDPDTWKHEPLRRFIGNMDETFPVIIRTTEITVKQETIKKLETLRDKPGFGENLQAFDEMLKKAELAANQDSAK